MIGGSRRRGRQSLSGCFDEGRIDRVSSGDGRRGVGAGKGLGGECFDVGNGILRGRCLLPGALRGHPWFVIRVVYHAGSGRLRGRPLHYYTAWSTLCGFWLLWYSRLLRTRTQRSLSCLRVTVPFLHIPSDSLQRTVFPLPKHSLLTSREFPLQLR